MLNHEAFKRSFFCTTYLDFIIFHSLENWNLDQNFDTTDTLSHKII